MFKNKIFLYNILLFIILALAAFMRLYRIQDYMTFLGDEGRDVLVAYGILHGKLTLLGPTASVGGFFFGPIYYYFMTPFLFLFNYNPVGPAVMIALLGIFSVYLLYYLGSLFFNKAVGLIAALLYAISPLIISFSRSSWNPYAIPPFVLLTALFLYKYIHTFQEKGSRKSWYLIIAGFFYGITFQLHYVTLFFGIAIATYFSFLYWLTLKNMSERIAAIVRSYVLFGAGFIAGISPIIAFELRHSFTNTRNIVTFILFSKDTGAGRQILPTIWEVFFKIFGRGMWYFPPPEQFFWYPKWIVITWEIAISIFALSAVGIFIWQVWRVYKRHAERAASEKLVPLGESEESRLLIYLFILIWFGSFLLFGIYKKQIYEYYFQYLYPVAFWLAGNLFVFLWSKKQYFKIVAVGLGLFLMGLNLSGMPFRFAPNRQLNQMETISHFIFDKTQGQPFNFALVTGGNSDFAYRYFFTLWGNSPVTIQNAVVDPQRATVTKQLFVVCESLPCQPLGASLWEVAGYGRAEIAGKWDVSVVQIYKLVPYKGK